MCLCQAQIPHLVSPIPAWPPTLYIQAQEVWLSALRVSMDHQFYLWVSTPHNTHSISYHPPFSPHTPSHPSPPISHLPPIPHYHSSTLRTALQSLELAVDKVSLIANTLNQPDISDEVSGIPHLTLLVPTDDIIIPHLTLSSDDVIIPHLTLCILLMMSSFLI